MSKEYIDREALETELNHTLNFLMEENGEYDHYTSGFEECVYRVENFPAADVAPVQHGRWTFGKDLPDSFGSMNKNKYHLYCSECRHQAFNKSADNDYDFDMDTPFCPWCGSKMVEEEVRENIKDAPTAAVVEVRHGQWIRKEDDSCYWYECSECGEKLAKTQWGNDYFSAYCPNCGTLMDKEE